jgi:hypothetical protein
MPVRKFTCPDCEAVLRPAKPLPSGKRVTCPKCGAGFVVRGDDEEAAPEGKPTKKSSTPAATAKPDPFGDDGPETYAVIKEEEPPEEEEDEDEDEDYDEDDDDRPRKKKPKKDTARMEDLEFRLNTAVTDLRGPAQAALISPSNFLMLCAFITILVSVLVLAYAAWHFLFMENLGLDIGAVVNMNKKKDGEDKSGGGGGASNVPTDVDLSKLTPEQKDRYWQVHDAWLWFLIFLIVASLFVIGYNAVIIVGGVKMQNMESYSWSMIATIMAFVPLCFPGLGQIAALMSLTALRSKKVIDGFFYVPPSATPMARPKGQAL